MIIIWGSRCRVKLEAEIPFYPCKFCSEPDIGILSSCYWFTLFFIPIFPTGTKKYFIACDSCENSYKISREQANEIFEYIKNCKNKDE